MTVLVVLVAPLLAAGQAAASSNGDPMAAPAAANARALPPISVMRHDPLQSEEPSAPVQAELLNDSPIDINLLLLAAWLPIAGALLALAMEGPGPKVRRARAPGEAPSLD